MKLPDIDELFTIAQQDPERLEALRRQAINALIDASSGRQKKRLEGLQFQIDMARRRYKTPISSCLALSHMMHEQLNTMHSLLADVRDGHCPERLTGERQNDTDNVLVFRDAQADCG